MTLYYVRNIDKPIVEKGGVQVLATLTIRIGGFIKSLLYRCIVLIIERRP